jgi:hypothetical protein
MPAAIEIPVGVDTILLQSDALDLVLARDVVGAPYLCSLISIDGNGHHFAAVQISSERLTALRSGKIDLRSALAKPERQQYFEGWLRATEMQTIYLTEVDGFSELWLPLDGFFLNAFDHEAVASSDVVEGAIAKNAAVIVCELNPLESMGLVAKIDADRLAKSIKKFQDLVRESAKKRLKELSESFKKNAVDPTALQVFAFSSGSFNVHFESKDLADIFGQSVVGTAMQYIDELMQLAELSPDEIAGRLPRYRGAPLAAYHELLKFIDQGGSMFSYRWSDPGMTVPKRSRMSPQAAKAISAILERESTLKAEAITFVARFTSVNTDRPPYSWIARDTDNAKRTGHVHESSAQVLNDVRIRTQSYVFDCENRLVATPSGDPVWKLFLRTLTEVQSDT